MPFDYTIITIVYAIANPKSNLGAFFTWAAACWARITIYGAEFGLVICHKRLKPTPYTAPDLRDKRWLYNAHAGIRGNMDTDSTKSRQRATIRII